MAFNLKEEAQGEIESLFLSAVEEIAAETQKFAEEMSVFCENASHRELTNLVNKYIGMYKEDIRTEFGLFFQEWRDSESSLYEFAVASGSGEITEDIAKNLEDRLEEGIDIMCPDIDEVPPPTVGAEWNDDYIDELKNMTEALISRLESARDTTTGNLSSLSEDNTAFGCISGIVEYAFNAPIKLFEEINAE